MSTSTETREFSVGEAFIVNFTITDPGKPAGHNVSWTFNDRPFTGNNKVTILENGLQFMETQFEDQGTYVASFDNTAAVSTFTFSYGMVMSESAGFAIRGMYSCDFLNQVFFIIHIIHICCFVSTII